MSVMKLNAEEYLYLSKFLGTLNLKNDAFDEEVLLNENIYNAVRNLNVLGLCERYNDLFAESWANNNEKYEEIYSKYYSFDNISNEKILSSGKISEKDINNPKKLLGHLIYNSFSNNYYYSELYKVFAKENYEKALEKDEKYRTHDDNELIRCYKLNVVDEKEIENEKKQPLTEWLNKNVMEYYNNRLMQLKQLNFTDSINNMTGENTKKSIIDIAEHLSKYKALFDLANDKVLMRSKLLDFDLIKGQIDKYAEFSIAVAKDIYQINFEKDKVHTSQHNLEETNKEYKAEIDKVLSESYVRKDEYNDVRICKTPAIYGEIGLDTTKDIFMSREHIRYDNRIHGIEKEQLYNIPELLKEPAIIMKSQNHAKSIIAILNDVDNNNVPIMASIYPDGQAKYHFEKIDSNFITSVYGKDNFKNFINNALNDNRLLFTDQKVINELEKKAGIGIFKEKQVLTKNDILQQ